MYKIKTIALVAGIATLLTACNNNKVSFDASGSFEAEETIISSEATGTIKRLEIEEGQTLEAGQVIGYIDSLQLYLKKKQLEAQVTAILGKKPNIPVQISALQETAYNCRKGTDKNSQFGKRRCSYTQAVRRHQCTD
jgi:HlyD family secretion protein